MNRYIIAVILIPKPPTSEVFILISMNEFPPPKTTHTVCSFNVNFRDKMTQ